MAFREEKLALGRGNLPLEPVLAATPDKIIGANSSNGFTRADFYLLLCVSLWGFNVPLVKVILNYLDPLVISLIRFGVAGLIFAVMTWGRERSLKVQWKHLGLICACALSGITLNQVFFVYALKNSPSSEVSLLMSSTATFATIAAWLLGQDKIRRNFWYSLPVSVSGVALIVLTAPGAHLNDSWLGVVLALGMAASWATYTVLLRPLMKYYSIIKISAYVSLIGSVALLPFGYGQFDAAKLMAMPGEAWFYLAFCTLIAVVLTNILWYTGVKRLGAARTAFYSYFQPFVGVLAAFLILQEGVVLWQSLGCILIIAGLIIYRRK